MESQTKICQNCKKDFIIETDDFSFYEKIKVPPPTFCPECRMIRRMTWRNVRSLNKRECGLCKKRLISMYPNDGAPVFCVDCYNSDNWDQFETGVDYDFTQKFFIQWSQLLKKAPRLFAYRSGNIINSDYSNYTIDNKNVYLSYSVVGCEDVMYSESIDKSKKSLDCYGSQKLDNCYNNIDSDGNYNTHYSVKSKNCIDSHFLYDCINCQECCLSSNLRNSKYFFKNEKLTKEKYTEEIEKLKINTYLGLCESIKSFDYLMDNIAIHRYSQIFNSTNVSGDNIKNSNNIYKSFNIQDSENIKYSNRVLIHTKDSMDLQGLGAGELIYESVAASFNTYKDYFCYITLESKECEYSFLLKNCSNCFACFGLRNASYCIFNKQYKKEEYNILLLKIKQHMSDLPYVDTKGRIYKYGEFFPFELSPFGYNETNNLDYFPIDKEEAFVKGYPWREKEKKDYNITLKSENLPQNINNVSDSILNKIISCPNDGNQIYQCSTAYRIMPEELQFYKQKMLPLPRYCPNCRHYQRLKYVSPLKLWRRTCMHEGCINEFETTYNPEKPGIIYCEKCYQQKVI